MVFKTLFYANRVQMKKAPTRIIHVSAFFEVGATGFEPVTPCL